MSEPHAGWKVYRAVRTKDSLYHWRVVGWNRYTGELFDWAVPDLTCGSYDMSEAVIIAERTPDTGLGTGWSRYL